MKKNQLNLSRRYSGKGFLLPMKLTFILFLICILNSHASVYSQNTILEIKKGNVEIDQLLLDFDQQSEFRFFYESDLFKDEAPLRISEKKIKVEAFLEKYLSPRGYSYSVVDKTVILKKQNQQETQLPVKAQKDKTIHVKGVVTDEGGMPLPGVTVMVAGSTRGVITDPDGRYDIHVLPTAQLSFSFIGMTTQVVAVNSKTELNVVLSEKKEELEGVTVVAFGKQKKESVMASIETVRPGELKIPSSNLTTAMAGRMSGLISYQTSGEPGADDASFFVRGVTSFTYAAGPLILIDGVESTTQDLSRMQPDDIASFSIMKDAAATALYGARGGNGVIMIVTKQGKEGKLKVNVRHEQSWNTATEKIDVVDPISYMKYNNEAALARNPFATRPYSLEKIERTEAGVNPYVYPANNWYDLVFNDVTHNTRTNINFSGGTKKARYYIAGSFNDDNGNLKVDNQNNFNSNISIKTYQLRSNININLTKTTEAVVRFYGRFKDYVGPLNGGSDMYSKIMRTDPAAFAPYYEPVDGITHILFGNIENANLINPYADLVRGYKETTDTKMQSQAEIKQDLDFITNGLSARALLSTSRTSYFGANRKYTPFYYYIDEGAYDVHTNEYELTAANPQSGTEWLSYDESGKKIHVTNYYEFALNYNRTFADRHSVSGLLVATQRSYSSPGAKDKDGGSSLVLSLPTRNVGYAGRFTYAFDGKYFSEFNFGYNGSERFAPNNRWGFFPSMGLGYLLSKESFWNGFLERNITSCKLKATYGLSGSDAIGDKNDRFFYLSNINLDDKDRGYYWGELGAVKSNGVKLIRYPNEFITWQTSKTLNLGLELELWKKLDISAEYYTRYTTDILMERKNVPSTMGLLTTPKTNVGEASTNGVDLSVDYNQNWQSGFWLTGRVNFTYARSKYEVYEDVDRSATPWLNRIGQSTSQKWGYIAERLFIDEADVNNSPIQSFSDYGPGDIKYRDINGDGKISYDDQVPIGHPTSPEIIYGFGFNLGYKGFDLGCFFQGLGNRSFWIDSKKTAPFVDTDGDNKVTSKNAFLQVYADNHWSAENPDPYALWPKLTNRSLANNEQTSTWWMRDGSFLRLKSLEIGYSLPKVAAQKIRVRSLRIYVSGSNLLTFSKFKLWDAEMANNAFKYPIQKVYNLGLQIGF